MRAARLRASKLPNPVICTFAPFFNSPAMMPLSSNRASIVRVASAFDILVRMARAAVSSALFTLSPCGGLGPEKALMFRPFSRGGRPKSPESRHNMGVCRENPQDTGTSLTHPPGETTLPPRCQPQAVSRKHAVLGLGTACNLTPCGLRVTTCDQGWRMFHGTRPGWIEVISGVMFAGKSEELIRRVRRAVIARKQVQVFKSHLDSRYAGLYSVISHDADTATRSRSAMKTRRPCWRDIRHQTSDISVLTSDV